MADFDDTIWRFRPYAFGKPPDRIVKVPPGLRNSMQMQRQDNRVASSDPFKSRVTAKEDEWNRHIDYRER
jgi:hypothetical protein